MRTFEEYLRDDVWEPEGVLDDDMPDAFDSWLGDLDTQEVMDYADKYGSLEYSRGLDDMKKAAVETYNKLT